MIMKTDSLPSNLHRDVFCRLEVISFVNEKWLLIYIYIYIYIYILEEKETYSTAPGLEEIVGVWD